MDGELTLFGHTLGTPSKLTALGARFAGIVAVAVLISALAAATMMSPEPTPAPGLVSFEVIETTSANNFGGRSETWRGFDLTADARLQNLTLRGGLSTGSTSFDRCSLAASVPETVGGQFCDTSTNWLTQVQLLGSYTFPYDIQVAGTLRSMPGREREAQWQFDASATDLAAVRRRR